MYNVFLVDDEPILLEGIRSKIDWESIGLNFVGEATDGEIALSMMQELKPDILITDVKMPFMDGIEFSKIAMRQYPHLKIIVLTAMNEFEYARQCVGIGVCEYLTKPIVRANVMEALKKVTAELEQSGVRPHEEEKEKKTDKNFYGGMGNICDFINNNYKNSEINLTYVANKFGFNPSYLSRRFKEETGMSFVDYVTKCRMDKAIELLHKKTAMYITAREVGIPDPNYFSKCFKQHYGMTPTEYKDTKNKTNK